MSMETSPNHWGNILRLLLEGLASVAHSWFRRLLRSSVTMCLWMLWITKPDQFDFTWYAWYVWNVHLPRICVSTAAMNFCDSIDT